MSVDPRASIAGKCVSGLLPQELSVDPRDGTDIRLQSYLRPSMERLVFRARMEVARGDANRALGPDGHAFFGVSPRRSDRCATRTRGSPPRKE